MLPVYELRIDDESTEVNAVAAVDVPAIQKGFLAFKNDDANPVTMELKFDGVNEEQRVVFGAAMIPNLKIYRKDPETQTEYEVFFSADTIQKIAVQFFEKGYQKNFNLMHDGKILDGVVFFQSLIKDDTKGIEGLKGEYPNGTWFLGAKINNDIVWDKIKSGEIKGWSVEGMFAYHEPKETDLIEKLKQVLQSQLTDEEMFKQIESMLS